MKEELRAQQETFEQEQMRMQEEKEETKRVYP